MTRINLLPWREALYKQRQTEFTLGIVLVIVTAVVILFSVQAYLDSLIIEQQDKKSIVTAKIAEVNLMIVKIQDIETQNAQLRSKRSAIQALQKSRYEAVRFIDAVAKVIPEGIYLTQLKQNDTGIELTGKAQSNVRVLEFISNVEANQWLVSPELNIITGKNDETKLSDFILLVKLRKSKTEEREGGGINEPV